MEPWQKWKKSRNFDDIKCPNHSPGDHLVALVLYVIPKYCPEKKSKFSENALLVCQMTPLKVWLWLLEIESINQLHVSVTTFMFPWSVTQIYDSEVRDKGSRSRLEPEPELKFLLQLCVKLNNFIFEFLLVTSTKLEIRIFEIARKMPFSVIIFGRKRMHLVISVI